MHIDTFYRICNDLIALQAIGGVFITLKCVTVRTIYSTLSLLGDYIEVF